MSRGQVEVSLRFTDPAALLVVTGCDHKKKKQRYDHKVAPIKNNKYINSFFKVNLGQIP